MKKKENKTLELLVFYFFHIILRIKLIKFSMVNNSCKWITCFKKFINYLNTRSKSVSIIIWRPAVIR